MTFKEGMEEKWKEGLAVNTDSYGKCCYVVAEKWADALEEAIEMKKKVNS